MPEKLKVCAVREEELQEVKWLARSRKEPIRIVQRAKLNELEAPLLAGLAYWNAHKHPYIWK